MRGAWRGGAWCAARRLGGAALARRLVRPRHLVALHTSLATGSGMGCGRERHFPAHTFEESSAVEVSCETMNTNEHCLRTLSTSVDSELNIQQETTRPTRPDRRDAEADGVGKPTRNGCPRSKRIEVPEEIIQIREQICLLFLFILYTPAHASPFAFRSQESGPGGCRAPPCAMKKSTRPISLAADDRRRQ